MHVPLKLHPPSRSLLRGVLWGVGLVLGTLRHLAGSQGPLPVEVKSTSVSAALRGNLSLGGFDSDTHARQDAGSIPAASTIAMP